MPEPAARRRLRQAMGAARIERETANGGALSDADLEILTEVVPNKIRWNGWSSIADGTDAIAVLGREVKRLRAVEEQLRAELSSQRERIAAELDAHAADCQALGLDMEAMHMTGAAQYVRSDPDSEADDD